MKKFFLSTALFVVALAANAQYNFNEISNTRLGRDLHLQLPGASENDWTRSVIANRLYWDNGTKLWTRAPYHVDGSGTEFYQPDMGMIRFKNNGAIGLYSGMVWSSSELTFNNTSMESYLRLLISSSGQVGIGVDGTTLSSEPNYKLVVDGKVLCEELKVELSENWGDFVFDENYNLMSLEETEVYIKENNHLPGIESAEELETSGVDLGEMVRKQMIKIEELTLHTIEQQKEIKEQKALLEKQAALIEKLIKNQLK